MAMSGAHLTAEPSALRRIALLGAMLISGGLMLFPREPILIAVIGLCLLITQFRLPLRREMTPVAWVLLAVLVVTLVRPGPVSLPSLVSRFTVYIAAILLLDVYLRASVGSLERDLRFLLAPMAWQAIATVILAHTVGGLFRPLAIGEQQYMTLLGIFNYHIVVEDLTSVIRPDGFFFEPGVYQIYLNLYLYLALFTFRQPRQAMLAAVAVLCTQSTTGLVIAVLLLGGSLVRQLTQEPPRRKLVALVVAALLAPPLFYLGYDNLNDKLFGVAQGSSWARQYDLFTGLNIIAENPWLGIGFEVSRYLAASGRLGFEETLLTAAQLAERPTSNGLVQLFYSLGIPLGLVFALGAVRQKFFRHRALIAAWLCLSMFGEALLFTPFFLMFIFSGYLAMPDWHKAAVRVRAGIGAGRRFARRTAAPRRTPLEAPR
jgi:hypothetical protein